MVCFGVSNDRRRREKVVVRRTASSLASPSFDGLIVECVPFLELRDVVDGCDGDVSERLARKECLMPGDDHVWKREQPAKYIIANDQA